MSELRCARCGRRVGIYLSELGPYLAHVIPFALHRAQLDRPTDDEIRRDSDA